MSYILKKNHYKLMFTGTVIALFFLIIFSSTLGVANISVVEAIKILLSKIPFVGHFVKASEEMTHNIIVLKIRLPRILLSALVGIGLSTVGASMQGMFKNPMADPGILGISTGAALGATVAIAFGLQKAFWGIGGVTFLAFICALATTFVVYNISKVGNKIPTVTLLLSGVAISFLFSSVNTLIMFFNHDKLEDMVLWTMGSVAAASWKQVIVVFPVVIIGSTILGLFSRDLNLMSTGSDTAKSLGVEVERTKKIILIITSIIVGACVSVSGIVGFVGLIIPHVIRLLLGSDHRVVMPFSAIGGAIFMVICDTLARNLIPPSEMPVGAITSLFGAPFFIYLLVKSKRRAF